MTNSPESACAAQTVEAVCEFTNAAEGARVHTRVPAETYGVVWLGQAVH